jgi:predicted ATPase
LAFAKTNRSFEARMIHRFRVQNFKSIIDVSVDLEAVTVLVGKSGTGKSNFVESIRALRDILLGQQPLQQLQQEWPQLRPATDPQALTRFEVEFSIVGIPERYSYKLSIGQHGLQQPPEEEILRLGEKVLFHQANARWVHEPELLQVPPAGLPALGRIPSISDVVVAFTALTSGIGCYIFPDKVLTGGRQDQPTSGLDDQAVNYLGALKEIVSNLQDLRVRKSMVAALQQVNPSVSSVELNDILRPSHAVVGHRFNGKTLALQLAQESDGFRRFYAHLLALYQRPPKQTLLFEHPEDGIHPGALALLAEEFIDAPTDSRGQVVLTTHSPKLLDHFEADQIRVVELDGFATRIGPISNVQKESIQDGLFDAGDLLTVDPAHLEAIDSESAQA